ncbi:MAG TPA: tetratricopeptide repeat protein [Steroidobacteraceae bacterium]|nr:tetratricopeptide repeat protein [Steroidobacteraceae bacterium]
MRRSSVERRCSAWLALLAGFGVGVAPAQMPVAPQRMVDVIEVAERDGQVDVTVVFNCSMRFVTNLPASQGSEVHIQLVPLSDCGVNPFGQVPSEIPPLSGGTGIVSAARVESLAPGQITLTLSFRKNERFVLAQGVDPRGLRVRLVDHASAAGRVLVAPTDMVANFAINLDSRPKAFPPEEVELAHQRLRVPVFVSEAMVDGEKWYRLRAGPIERRSDAERLLNNALPDYPRAWLAIGDDAVTSDLSATTAGALPAVERLGSDPPLPPEQQRQMLTQARAAMTARDYPKAIALLTKLQRQPEFPDRSRAQELLGLARERSGQLAHAKAEYEEYLRRYPNGEAAGRVAFRLKTLQAAEAKARTGREVGSEPRGWLLNGDFSQTGRYDGLRVTDSAPPSNGGTSATAAQAQAAQQSALFTDVDLVARRRGESFDFIGRLSGGYDKSFVSGTNIDPTRVSLASMELLDRSLGLLARLGRQASNSYGILGTFDGLFLSWQFSPSWAVNVAGGFPVNLLNVSPQTQQSFETVALVYTPRNAHWDANLFVAGQQYDGLRDRQAVGLEGRYLASRGSLVAVVDYDTFYRSLNTASLLGTLQLPARWNLSFDTEHRNAPVLTTGNALIGQSFSDLHEMQQVFTDEEIYQLARDRTAVSSYYSVTATRPLGQRFQLTAIVSASQTGATPASGGVPAQPATGKLPNYQLQLYASNLWHEGDFNVLTFQHGDTEIGKIDSASATLRFPLGGAWRLAPRFTVERLSQLSDGGNETSYIPSALLDYQRGNYLVQLETGAQLGSRESFLQLANGQVVQTQNTTSYYVSLSYRINFNH